jgi:hypothetical protein
VRKAECDAKHRGVAEHALREQPGVGVKLVRLSLLNSDSMSETQAPFSPQGDSVLWTVGWDEFLALEVAGTNDDTGPSRVIIHLRRWQHPRSLFESKAIMRSIRCQPGTPQAQQVYAAIKRAHAKYGPVEKASAVRVRGLRSYRL